MVTDRHRHRQTDRQTDKQVGTTIYCLQL